MRKLFLLLFALSVSAFAVDADVASVPRLLQMNECTSAATTCAFPVNVTSGNVLVVRYHARSQSTTPPISDTLGSTWTNRIAMTNNTDNRARLYVWTATAPSSGADTVTLTLTDTTNEFFHVGEWKNVVETLDGSVATDSTQAFAGNLTTSVSMPSVTTGFYNDLILYYVQPVGGEQVMPTVTTGANVSPLSSGNQSINDNPYTAYQIQGAPGATSAAFFGDVGRNVALATMALRSTTNLTVATTALPNAVSGSAYNFQLQATGGTGTNTWSVTSGTLPAGLSLSSAGVISGTPTASAGSCCTFQVTDAGSHTATASLTLTVGTSFNTITKIQSAAPCGALTVTAGDTLVVIPLGFNTVQYVSTTDSATHFVQIPTRGLGANANNGVGGAALASYIWVATVGTTGSQTISSTTPGTLYCSEWSNVQYVFDSSRFTSKYSYSGGATITASSTTLDSSNTMLALAQIGTSGGTLTVSGTTSDFNGITGSTLFSVAYSIGVSGAQTPSWSVTGNTSNMWAVMVIGMRPTTSGTAPSGGVLRHTGNAIIQ